MKNLITLIIMLGFASNVLADEYIQRLSQLRIAPPAEFLSSHLTSEVKPVSEIPTDQIEELRRIAINAVTILEEAKLSLKSKVLDPTEESIILFSIDKAYQTSGQSKYETFMRERLMRGLSLHRLINDNMQSEIQYERLKIDSLYKAMDSALELKANKKDMYETNAYEMSEFAIEHFLDLTPFAHGVFKPENRYKILRYLMKALIWDLNLSKKRTDFARIIVKVYDNLELIDTFPEFNQKYQHLNSIYIEVFNELKPE